MISEDVASIFSGTTAPREKDSDGSGVVGTTGSTSVRTTWSTPVSKHTTMYKRQGSEGLLSIFGNSSYPNYDYMLDNAGDDISLAAKSNLSEEKLEGRGLKESNTFDEMLDE